MTQRAVVAGLKGGVGKTTSAVNLAAAFVRRFGGQEAVIIDADPQASAATWLDTDPIEGVSVVEAPSERLLAKALGVDVAPGTLVVVDTPPAGGQLLQTALAAADVVLLPTRPGLLEVPRLVEAIRLVPPGIRRGIAVIAARRGTRVLEETLAGWTEAGEAIWGVVPERVSVQSGEIALDVELAYTEILGRVLNIGVPA